MRNYVQPTEVIYTFTKPVRISRFLKTINTTDTLQAFVFAVIHSIILREAPPYKPRAIIPQYTVVWWCGSAYGYRYR